MQFFTVDIVNKFLAFDEVIINLLTYSTTRFWAAFHAFKNPNCHYQKATLSTYSRLCHPKFLRPTRTLHHYLYLELPTRCHAENEKFSNHFAFTARYKYRKWSTLIFLWGNSVRIRRVSKGFVMMRDIFFIYLLHLLFYFLNDGNRWSVWITRIFDLRPWIFTRYI